MKNLKLVPFALIGLYFTSMYFFPELVIEIKLIFTLIIILLSSIILFQQFKAGKIEKNRAYVLGGVIIVSLLIFLYYLLPLYKS